MLAAEVYWTFFQFHLNWSITISLSSCFFHKFFSIKTLGKIWKLLRFSCTLIFHEGTQATLFFVRIKLCHSLTLGRYLPWKGFSPESKRRWDPKLNPSEGGNWNYFRWGVLIWSEWSRNPLILMSMMILTWSWRRVPIHIIGRVSSLLWSW